MKTLVLLALAGLGAQLVDGSLGMAYGVTSTTLLLAIGTNPAAASATVHLAEIGTTLMSGVAHWRFGNVDWRVVAKIGIPGAIGAFAGATVLSNLSTEVAAPVMSMILLGLGVYLLVRFTLRGIDRRNLGKPMRKRFLGPLGLVAGFVDATGGGGWGPVGTPAILASGRMEPRKVIGSIDTSEFLVALAASLGFLFSLGSQGIDVGWVLALLIGGMVAAPIAAWLVRHVPPRLLGSLVGGIIIVTNTRTLLRSDWIDAPDGVRYAVYAVLYVVWAAAVAWSFVQYRKDRAQESADALAAEAARLAAPEEREPNHVVPPADAADVADLQRSLTAGRPAAPQD
ncbi:sulfite exporter TauE/SafE family protein [Blastococcus sp. SYSU D00695]